MGWGAGGSCTPRPPIRPQTAQETRVITVVFLGLLLDLLAFTLLLPLLPGLLESHGRAHVRLPLRPCLEAPRLPPPQLPVPRTLVTVPCPPGPPLWLVAAGSGLVCRCDQDAGREEVQQRPLRR